MMKNKRQSRRWILFLMLSVFLLTFLRNYVLCGSPLPEDLNDFVKKMKLAHKYGERGQKALKENALDNAEKNIQKALQFYPHHAASRFCLAQIFYKKEEYKQALEQVKRAKKDYIFTMERIIQFQKETQSKSQMKKMDMESQKRFLEGIYDQFVAKCAINAALSGVNKQIFKLDQEEAAIRNLRLSVPADFEFFHGNILFKLHLYSQAIDRYSEAIRINPQHSYSYTNIVNIFYILKKYRRAMEYVNLASANGGSVHPPLKKAIIKKLRGGFNDLLELDFPEGIHLVMVNAGDKKNPFYENTYIVFDNDTLDAVIIDPGVKDPRIEKFIASMKLNVCKILNTHGHKDHIGANRYYAELYGVEIAAHAADKNLYPQGNLPDVFFEGEEMMRTGSLKISIVHTPGHTPGSVCYHIKRCIFSGDTLMERAIGKPYAGDKKSQEAYLSLQVKGIKQKLLSLPEDTRIFPGHGISTSVRREKHTNPFLK